MSIRSITHKESLDGVWEDLTYSEARLLSDADARDLAPAVSGLIDRCEKIRQEQRATWRAEIGAQAAVDAADDALDAAVLGCNEALLEVVRQDRSHPRYQRYFKRAPSLVLRLGLQSEMEVVGAWPDSLATEPEEPLKMAGQALSMAIAIGEGALEARRKAASERSDQRVRGVLPFLDDANRVRLSLYGELVRRGVEKKLGKGWARGFFPVGRRSDKEELDGDG